MTEPNARNAGLDLLRAIAILLVVCLHAGQLMPGTPAALALSAAYGWIGVDIFFVLSGFLIARQLFEENETGPGRFYLKRWFRTLPLYYTVLFFYTVVKPRLGFPFQGDPLRYLFFLQNYTGDTDFVPSWSLCIEEQFYLVFPLLALLARRLKAPAVLWLIPLMISAGARCTFAASLGWQGTSLTAFSNEVLFKTHMHLDGLSLGVFLAATAGAWKRWSDGRAYLSLGLGLAVVFLTLYFGGKPWEGPGMVYCFSGLAVGISLLFPWAIRAKLSLPSSRPARWIALWSYGIYIWSDVISHALRRAPLPQGVWWAGDCLFFLLSFGVAILTYRWIEKPFLGIRNRLLAH